MDRILFERNLLALSARHPALCSRLSSAETTRGHYKFLNAKNGDTVPALVDPQGAAHPLHSLVDPRREGERLISQGDSLEDKDSAGTKQDGFLIFFGLGGGFYIKAALEREHINLILAIDYHIHGIAELLASQDYIAIFNDPRFHLLADPDPDTVERYILGIYQPLLYGGIRVIPLRQRIEADQARFAGAREGVENAIKGLSGDYSTQAFFGGRWFSNIIRNCLQAEGDAAPLPPIRDAAITAAGPSLEEQLPALKAKRKSRFVLATDTSLPALLQGGIIPDGVISIDCQHISYYHFMRGFPRGIPLFLDLASPPLLKTFSETVYFFAGGHPLTRYIALRWRAFPELDTSGANVTYAALALTEALGAKTVELYGADFSYPLGKTYARGTYIYPHFEARQHRLTPLEELFSAFLYRNPILRKEGKTPDGWRYETNALGTYRTLLEAKAPQLNLTLIPIPGGGAPISISPGGGGKGGGKTVKLFAPGKAASSAADFLRQYREDTERLPIPGNGITSYLQGLDNQQTKILTTLLPLAASIKRRDPSLSLGELVREAKTFCAAALEKLLSA